MKILILSNFANGLYLFRKELLLSFLSSGHQIVISVPPDEHVQRLTRLAEGFEKQFEIVETPFERRGNNPVKDAGLFLRYRKLLGQKKPDVVLTYTIKPNLYGGLACRLCRVPYICNVTGLGTAIEGGGMLSRLLILFYKLAVGKAERVFFQNSGNRDFMLQYGVAKKNADLLPGSGVNLTENGYETYPSEEGGINILAVIRVMKDKGIEEYLEAVSEIAAQNAGVHFRLIGDYEKETRTLYEPSIRKLQDAGYLQYDGHSDRVHQIMAESHIIVHPSYHEGMSNVLLEAAACGRPVLASHVHGCIETLEEGVSGFSFEKANSKALIQALEKILALSESDRQKMGQAGRLRMEEQFDRTLILRKYEKEFQMIERRKK